MANRPTKELEKLSYGTPGDDSDRRLGELMLYIADRCSGDRYLGAIKLNKLLYFADFIAFAHRGQSITQAEYMSLPLGPVPRRLKYVRENMQADGSLTTRESSVYKHTQKRIVPLRDADLGVFDGWEIALVDELIDLCEGQSAHDMSELSHDRVWEIAGIDRGPIPYEAVFISLQTPTPYDIAKSHELITEAEHGGVPAP